MPEREYQKTTLLSLQVKQQTRKKDELEECVPASWKRERLALDGSCEGEIVSISEGWWCGVERAWMMGSEVRKREG